MNFSKNVCCICLAKLTIWNSVSANYVDESDFQLSAIPYSSFEEFYFTLFGKMPEISIFMGKYENIIVPLQKLNLYIGFEEGVCICSIWNWFFDDEGNVWKFDHKNHHEGLIWVSFIYQDCTKNYSSNEQHPSP